MPKTTSTSTNTDQKTQVFLISGLMVLTLLSGLGLIYLLFGAQSVTVTNPILVQSSGHTFTNMTAAMTDAQTGDTITIAAGTRLTGGDALALITKNNLTIKGLPDANGNRPVMDANYLNMNDKGTWVVNGSPVVNFTVDGIEFIHAKGTTCTNGSGIRFQGTGMLTVKNSYFHDNESGVLAGNSVAEVLIENSIFDANGYDGDPLPDDPLHCAEGQSHNMYITANKFTLRNSYTHRAKHGHNIKTRSKENHIEYNRVMDETPDPLVAGSGTASYEINVPDGGLTYIIGNVVEQSPSSENNIIVRYNEDGANADKHLYVTNNTFVNNKSAGPFISIDGTSPTPTAVVQNNIFYGPGSPWTGGNVTANNNYVEASVPRQNAVKFEDPANYNFHILAGSPAINAGATLTAPLAPTAQYVYDTNSESRTVVGTAIDQGAFEFGNTGADTIAPVAGITSPVAGTTVTGQVPVAATATDNVGVIGVQLQVDGVNVGAEDTAAPYVLSWNSTTNGNTGHILQVIARDAAGNRTTSPSIIVTSQNVGSGTTGGSGGCFPGQTLVNTPFGLKPIGALKMGDAIYAYDQATGRTVISTISQTFVHPNEPYGAVTFGDGSSLEVTAVHRFFNPATKQWQEIGTMKPGDTVLVGLGSAAKPVTITSMEFISHRGTVYNLEVARYHTFYVDEVLVHNLKKK